MGLKHRISVGKFKVEKKILTFKISENLALISATISRAADLESSLKYFDTYKDPTALESEPEAAPTHLRHLNSAQINKHIRQKRYIRHGKVNKLGVLVFCKLWCTTAPSNVHWRIQVLALL